ncbi:hypothetical protein IFM89_019448 [Coptis chinensis]|uniref:Large ribosomal subunit protein bL9 C-terminal domain-containing protein n=1 Tax=Coptis chinensis TaxID=261450 RepID=A0A835LN47_9MAGN|nr:hypothetical protein IFM89_019448 [Coptis chinensis]
MLNLIRMKTPSIKQTTEALQSEHPIEGGVDISSEDTQILYKTANAVESTRGFEGVALKQDQVVDDDAVNQPVLDPNEAIVLSIESVPKTPKNSSSIGNEDVILPAKDVDKRFVSLPEIRETGEYIAELKLHPEVTARIRVNVYAN